MKAFGRSQPKQRADENMSRKRTKGITITYYRRRRTSRRRTETVGCCPVCGHNSEMMTEEAAIRLVGISRSMLNEWVAGNHVHVTHSGRSRLRICCGCLVERVVRARIETHGSSASLRAAREMANGTNFGKNLRLKKRR
jgi:hypothetical protein